MTDLNVSDTVESHEDIMSDQQIIEINTEKKKMFNINYTTFANVIIGIGKFLRQSGGPT